MSGWLDAGPPADPGWDTAHWQALRTVARVHGVGPLLHRALEPAFWLPEEERDWFAKQYRLNGRRMRRLHADLAEILEVFAAGRIPIMPLKGSLLSARDYPDPALRPMADLDLLVRPSDMAQAQDALAELGYVRVSASWKHQEYGRPGNLEVVDFEFEHPENPRKLDLHVAVGEMLAGPSVDVTARLWESALPGKLLGHPAWIPANETLWLHLLIHTNANIWGLAGRLINLYDLALIPPPERLPPVDGRFTYLALHLLERVFPDPSLAPLVEQAGAGLEPAFLDFAASFGLHGSSHLGREVAAPYLSRLGRFYKGRPRDLLSALGFLIFPQPGEVEFAAGQGAGGLRQALAWGTLVAKKVSLIARLVRG